jgi:hypothetical protein
MGNIIVVTKINFSTKGSIHDHEFDFESIHRMRGKEIFSEKNKLYLINDGT